MNKKENPLVQNMQNSGKRSIHRLYFKKQIKFQLPKITNSSVGQPNGQKTIAQLVEKLQKFTKDSKNDPYPLICECLRVLKSEKFQKKDQLIGKFHQTELIEKENEFQTAEEIQSISKSQVVNIEKCNIRRIQSKDLFEKVACMKYLNGGLQNTSDKQVISTLMGKIKQKESVIKQLQNQIDELNKSANKQKAFIAAQAHSNQLILLEKEKLFKENLSKTNQINQLAKSISKISQEAKEKVQANIKLGQRCKLLEAQIKEREQQLTSMWQLAIQTNPAF